METKEGTTTTLMPAAKAFAGTGAEATSSAGGGGGGDGKKPKVPMPQVLLDYILSWTRMGPWPSSDDDSEFFLSPEHRNKDDDDDGFAVFEAKVRAQREELSAFLDKKDDEFAVFQAKVRDEVDENGCYMVDGTYFAELEAAQALSDELFAKLNMSGILFEDD
uniref:Uncharacterized protein n=1 Tax=Oryza meridionalis TaxID=40149 RepID=A0A0E0EJB8_9ORYZ